MIYGPEYKISKGCAKAKLCRCWKSPTGYVGTELIVGGTYEEPDTALQTGGSQWVAGYGRGASQQGDRTQRAGIDVVVRMS